MIEVVALTEVACPPLGQTCFLNKSQVVPKKKHQTVIQSLHLTCAVPPLFTLKDVTPHRSQESEEKFTREQLF